MTQRHESMSGVDIAWLHMDRPANLMQIMGVMRFRRRLPLAALRERIETRFLSHPRFGKRPVDGALDASWQEVADFDLREHVREHTLPRGGGDAALQRLLGRLAATPLDPARPRWEFLLVHVTPRRSALVVRIHHCYADGIALVKVILALGDGAVSEPAVGSRASRREPQGEPGWLAQLAPDALSRAWHEAGTLLGQGLHLATHPGEAASVALAGIDIATELARIALLPDEPSTPLRGRLSGEKALAWARPMPLETVRAAAKALGCTINDLLVAAVAGALSRWLRDQDARVPSGLELRAAVPVNLRAPGAAEVLGNRFGLVFLPLPVGVATELQRIVAIRQRMQALRTSQQPLMTLGLLAALGLGPRHLQDGAVDVLSRKASLVLSNLPGPRTPLLLLGAPVATMMFWVPQSGDVGLGVSLLTYDGQVQLGVMADVALVPAPGEIAAYFPAELRRFARVAGVST